MNSQTMQSDNAFSQLCDRFTRIFQQIKDLKLTTQQIEEDNQKIMQLIEEEKERSTQIQRQSEMQQMDLRTHIEQLEKENIEENVQNEKFSKEYEQVIIENQQRKEVLEKIQCKYRENLSQQKAYQEVKQNLEKQMDFLLKQINILKDKIAQHQKYFLEGEQNLIEVENKSNDLLQKSQDTALAISANERYLKESLEQKYVKESYYKTNLQEFRSALTKKASYKQQLAISEKAVCKLSDELQSKLKRVEILSKNQLTLSEKLKQLEEQYVLYENFTNKNNYLTLQNQELLQKISLYSTEYQPKKEQQKNTVNHHSALESSQYPTKLDKETQLYKEAKKHIMLEDYASNIKQQITDKDNQIFQNKQLINDLNEAIEKIKKENFSEQIEIEKLNTKYQVIQETNQKQRLKYSSMKEQAGISQIHDSPSKLLLQRDIQPNHYEELLNQMALDQQMLSEKSQLQYTEINSIKNNL